MTVIETPVSHAQAAEELIVRIRSLYPLVPGFQLLQTPLDRYARPRGQRSLPDEFFVPLERALIRSPRFSDVVAIKPFDIRDMLEYGAAYLPAAIEAERFARGIRHTVFSKRGNVGKLAIDAYRVARHMNLALDLGLIVPEVEEMKASVTRRRAEPVPKSPELPAPDAPVATTIHKP